MATFLRGNRVFAHASGALRAAFWMRRHPPPRALGPGHSRDPCAADKPVASEALSAFPARVPREAELKRKMTLRTVRTEAVLYSERENKMEGFTLFH